MHKIITTAALLAAGTALSNAASIGYDSFTTDLQSGVVYAWDFSGGSAAAKVGAASGSFTLENGSAKITGGSVWASGQGNTFSTGDFSVSFDIDGFTAINWQTLFSMKSNNSTYGDEYSLQVQANTSGQLMIYNKCAGAAAFAGIDSQDASGNDLNNISTGLLSGQTSGKTLTIVSDMTGTRTLTAYVDGVSVGAFYNWYASSSPALTGFQFGSVLGGTRGFPDGEISNIAIWNRALSSDEVRTLVVPEPSAFGLLAGIGALALVAARRRRSRK